MRRLFSPVPLWGADGSDEGEEGSNEEGQEGSSVSEESKRTLTSKELEAMTAKAASRGGRKATKALRDELGFESVEDMKAFIASKRQAEEQELSDQEKATKAAEATKAEAEAEKLAASALRRSVLIERQIVRAGVTDEKKTERIATLVQAELGSDLDPDEWNEAMKAAVASLEKDMPELFAGKRSAGSGDGGAKGGSTTETDDEAEREKALIAEYAARGLHIPAEI